MSEDEPTQGPSDKNLPMVAIVDDESGVRQTLVRGLERYGFVCRPYRSGTDFLDSLSFELPDCVVLDLRMAEMDGMTVLDRMPTAAAAVPIVVLTSHGDIGLAVKALKNGAVDFVEKPVSIKQFAGKLQQYIAESTVLRRQAEEVAESQSMLDRLTAREHEIATLVVGGSSNKEIARDLEISPRTVEVHRSNIFKKLDVRNAVELALIYEKAHISLRPAT